MTTRSKVAALYTQPETVIQDYERLFEIAGGSKAEMTAPTMTLLDYSTPLGGSTDNAISIFGKASDSLR